MGFDSETIRKSGSLAFFLLIITYIPIGISATTGLDPSWVFAINWAFNQGWQMGTDVIYTYGPLGFLTVPLPIGNHLFAGVILWMMFRYLLLYSLCSLAFHREPKLREKELLIVLMLIYITMLLVYDYTYLLVMTTFMYVVLYQQTQKRIYIGITIITITFALLSKFGIGIMSGCILGSYVIYEYVTERKLRALKYCLIIPVLTVAVWLLLYGNLNGLVTYFISSLSFSSGHVSAMTINPPVSWGALALFLLFFVSIPILLQDRYVWFLFIIMILTLFSHWRYAFARADGHILFFTSIVAIFYLLIIFILFLRNARQARIASVLAFLSLIPLMYNANYMKVSSQLISFIRPWTGIYSFAEEINAKRNFRLRLADSVQNIQKDRLPDELLNIIKDFSVDIYPSELMIKAANLQLNWKPRPILQSHMDFTPWLDKRNSEFFYSNQAPEFILWHKTNDEMEGIDQRYVLNDDPYSIFAMFDQYHIVYKSAEYTLLQKNSGHNLELLDTARADSVKWGEWIDVPQRVEAGLVRAQVHSERHWKSKLKRALYKDDAFYIEYMLNDGKVIRKRIVIDNAESGLWIQPFLMDISAPGNGFKALPVQKIKLTHAPEDAFAEQITIDWQFYKVNGNSLYAY